MRPVSVLSSWLHEVVYEFQGCRVKVKMGTMKMDIIEIFEGLEDVVRDFYLWRLRVLFK